MFNVRYYKKLYNMLIGSARIRDKEKVMGTIASLTQFLTDLRLCTSKC